jgi:hypothetical protein
MNVHDTLPEQISGASRQGYTSLSLNTPSPSETPRSQGHRTSHTATGLSWLTGDSRIVDKSEVCAEQRVVQEG